MSELWYFTVPVLHFQFLVFRKSDKISFCSTFLLFPDIVTQSLLVVCCKKHFQGAPYQVNTFSIFWQGFGYLRYFVASSQRSGIFLPHKHIIVAPFLRFWDLLYCICSYSIHVQPLLNFSALNPLVPDRTLKYGFSKKSCWYLILLTKSWLITPLIFVRFSKLKLQQHHRSRGFLPRKLYYCTVQIDLATCD